MKEIYRDRRGRFSTYRKLRNGPDLPDNHPIAVRMRREDEAAQQKAQRVAFENFRTRLIEQISAPNLLLQYFQTKGRNR